LSTSPFRFQLSSEARDRLVQLRDSLYLFGILTFSLPLKIPAIEAFLEAEIGREFPIRLSLYTFFLPLILGLTVLTHRGRIPEVWSRLRTPLLLVAALFVWMWLGAWFSEWRAHSLKHSARYSIHLAVFLTLLLLLRPQFEKNAIRTTLWWFVAVSLSTGLDVYWAGWNLQHELGKFGLRLELYYLPEWGRLSALFENPNPYGTASLVLLLLAGYALWRRCWISGALGLTAGVWGIVMSGSRNALVSLAAALFLSLCWLVWRHRGQKKWLSLSLCGALLFVLGSGAILTKTQPSAWTRLVSATQRLAQQDTYQQLERREERFAIYRLGWEYGWQHHKVLGDGVKNFGNAVFSNITEGHLKKLRHRKRIYNAHNALLTIWVEMGWVGLILALWFVGDWFWRHRQIAWGMLLPAIAVCAGQVFDYFVWQITFMTVQSVAFALIAGAVALRSPDAAEPQRPAVA
jgi:hypothetical protein